jgi:poly-gamma-glutamate synthesis protein (capsule biosynthesis protein)
MHWGGNWGYEVARQKRSFARRLIDAGAADLVHGHSSHHPRPLEIYRDRLILYGCGDFLNDYEGISGHEAYRPELTLMYFPVLEDGRLAQLTLAPMRLRRFRLQRASDEESGWLAGLLRDESRLPVERLPDGRLRVR